MLCVGLVAIPSYSLFLFNAGNASILPVDISGSGPGVLDVYSTEMDVEIINDEMEIDSDGSGVSAFLTMYGPHRVQSSMRNLPKWLQDYFVWWQEKIQKHDNDNDNGSNSGNDYNDTKYFILSCTKNDSRCGGLSDRFRYLPSILLLGSLTQRVVCIYYEVPHPLESYFQPPHNGVDWRCPQHVKERVVKQRTRDQVDNNDDSIPIFPLGAPFLLFKDREFAGDANKDAHCYEEEITTKECADRQLKYLSKRDDLQYIILKMSTGIDRVNDYNNMFQARSYKERMPTILTWQHVDLMGDIFRVMFEPVEELARHVNATMTRLGLVENEYTSVHMRARYPTPKLLKLMGKRGVRKFDQGEFDNFDFEAQNDGKLKKILMSLVNNAFHCDHLLKNAYRAAPFHNNTRARTLIKSNGPVYLSSDLKELIDHVVTHGVVLPDDKETKNQNENKTNHTSTIIPVSSSSSSSSSSSERNETTHIMHFDSRWSKGGAKGAEAYFPIMEDLLIMGGSLCVTHGIGSFGAFGAALAGNRCRAIYQPWHGNIEKCPNGRVMRAATNITKEHYLLGASTEKIDGRDGEGDREGKLVYDERIIWN